MENSEQEIEVVSTSEDVNFEEDISVTQSGDLESDDLLVDVEDDIDWQARAIKAEETIQKAKRKQKVERKSQQSSENKLKEPTNAATKEEAYLYAKGLDFDEVEYAHKIASLEEIPLTTVLENDLFKGWKDKREKEKKSELAQLGSSRGSGKTGPKKDLNTPGLSDEDHKALYKKRYGR